MGDCSLKDYKKTKEAECFFADDAGASAQAECEACIDELDGRWEEQQMKHHKDLLELQGKVVSLQKWHDDQAADAEKLLAQQSLEKSAMVDALNERVETKMRDLEAIRHQRVLTLQAEASQTRERLEDVSLCVQRCVSVHHKEMRDAYHEKLQDEESRCLKTIRNGHRSVQEAKKESERLQKDAARMLSAGSNWCICGVGRHEFALTVLVLYCRKMCDFGANRRSISVLQRTPFAEARPFDKLTIRRAAAFSFLNPSRQSVSFARNRIESFICSY